MSPLPPLTNFMINAITSRFHLKETIESHRPAILALLETKIYSSQIIDSLQHTDFTNMLAVEPCGFVRDCTLPKEVWGLLLPGGAAGVF